MKSSFPLTVLSDREKWKWISGEENSMLNIENVSCSFGKQEILHNVSLEIPKGEITAIVGPSGCGKTTLLKTCNRMVEEEGGTWDGAICLEETDIRSLSKEQLRTRVGMVFQQPVAFPHSIEKNLSYVLNYHGVRDRRQREEKICDCLTKAGLYEEVKDHMKMSAQKLSGGQKQRLAIAQSLCVNPQVLLLDEPCSALDQNNTLGIERTLLDLKGAYTFVIVTHNLEQADRIADHIVHMEAGRITDIYDAKFYK